MKKSIVISLLIAIALIIAGGGAGIEVVDRKTGNDVAIVEFPNGMRYAIAVMTENTSCQNIAILGALIEKAVLK